MEESFNSEFCTVAYQPADNVVLLTWKKFARLQDYRTPALFAQGLLLSHLYSEFVVDARSGFEDDKEDVAWGFDVLLPAMAKTSCSAVAFILNEVSPIEDEMDLWTAEFAKYFAVLRATSYRQAVELLGHRLQSQVFYTVKPGTRDTFLAELKRRGIAEASRREMGCYQYNWYLPAYTENEIYIQELWADTAAQAAHRQTPQYAALRQLKQQYITDTQVEIVPTGRSAPPNA